MFFHAPSASRRLPLPGSLSGSVRGAPPLAILIQTDAPPGNTRPRKPTAPRAPRPPFGGAGARRAAHAAASQPKNPTRSSLRSIVSR